DVARVQPGQRVELKARAAPFETLAVPVDRLAPAAGPGEGQSSVTVFCRLPPSRSLPGGAEGGALRPRRTGHARLTLDRRAPGRILLDRALRYLRTGFWG